MCLTMFSSIEVAEEDKNELQSGSERILYPPNPHRNIPILQFVRQHQVSSGLFRQHRVTMCCFRRPEPQRHKIQLPIFDTLIERMVICGRKDQLAQPSRPRGISSARRK